MYSSENDVCALRSKWKMELHEHFEVAKASIGQVVGERRKTPAPRGQFRRTDSAARTASHLFLQVVDQRVGLRITDTVCCRPDQRHNEHPPRSTKQLVRVGTYPDSSSRKSVGPQNYVNEPID